jgi:CRP-like cAMP-binding protein
MVFPIKLTRNEASSDCDLFILSRNNFEILNGKFPELNLGDNIRRFRILPILKSKSFNYSFSEELLNELSVMLVPTEFSTSDPIFSENEHGDSVYFIYKGYVQKLNGQLYQIGQFFGEEILNSECYLSTCIAIGSVHLLQLKKQQYFEIIKKFQNFELIFKK